MRLFPVFAILAAAVVLHGAETASLLPIEFEKQEKLFRKLNVLEAWRFTKGDSNVWVGIIDNGFDFFHPDLMGNLLPAF